MKSTGSFVTEVLSLPLVESVLAGFGPFVLVA